MDVGQLLPFISGYRKTTGEAKTSAGKINAFLRKANEDLRKLIEDSTPALFYLDTKVYTKACEDFAKDLRNPASGNRQYVAWVQYNKGKVYRADPEFEKALQSALSKYNVPKLDISVIGPKIASKENGLEQFSEPLTRNFDLINEAVAKNAAGIAAGDSIALGQLRYRITAAGRKTRTEFARLTPCRLLNPESIVVGFDKNTEGLFLGVSFSTIRSAVNAELSPTIIDSFKKAGIILSEKDSEKSKNTPAADINKRFTVGEIVIFGHTGAKYTDPETGATEILGFITPWVQQLMLLAAQNSTAASGVDIVNEFINISGQIDYSVQFTKEVSPAVKTLMKGQLAVIVPMSSALNKEILKGETNAVDQIVKTIFGTDMTYRKLRSNLISNVLQAANLKRIFTGLKFSPTLLESIEKGIVGAIKTGKFAKTARIASPIAKQSIVNKVSSGSKKSTSKVVKKVNVPKSTAKPIRKSSISAAATLNLVNLQNLINASLVEQVKRNMGTGNRRDVLNLRSGRFAESVRVERMSESRQGMITAFYSYMKNPYATFSQGGAQDTPKSRDPKLLIAKSIREIAAEQVANRLRSVAI